MRNGYWRVCGAGTEISRGGAGSHCDNCTDKKLGLAVLAGEKGVTGEKSDKRG